MLWAAAGSPSSECEPIPQYSETIKSPKSNFYVCFVLFCCRFDQKEKRGSGGGSGGGSERGKGGRGIELLESIKWGHCQCELCNYL